MQFIFDGSQLESILSHCQEKKFCVKERENFLESF